MGYQSVGWWRKHGRRFNMPARRLSPRSGSFSDPDLRQYARRQTHPVLAVDHGGGPSSWNISDGSTTVKARAQAGKRVYGYVVPAAAFKGASSGCLLSILTLGLATLTRRTPTAVREDDGRDRRSRRHP